MTLIVALPDGSTKSFAQRVRASDVAAAIGPGLAKAALVAEVDGAERDLSEWLPAEGTVQLKFLTKKDPAALRVMRHSCAHVMAQAVMRLFPGVQLAFGPTTEHGFYYDMQSPRSLSEEDFPKIEAEMAKIIKENQAFERIDLPRAKALELCADLRQQFKVEHIETGLANETELSFYRQGEFVDLCRGRHIPATGAIGAFKLLSIAGAYWKGDAKNAQLQRLYGTAWFSKEELEQYLQAVEEAKRRDHRVLGRQLELFTTSQLVGQGLILWLPKGATVRGLLEDFVKSELLKRGYTPVHTPNIGRVELYETSGHFPYYREAQFTPIFHHDAGQVVDYVIRKLDPADREMAKDLTPDQESRLIATARELGFDGEYRPTDSDADRCHCLKDWSRKHERYLLKPMNCPHHVMIYKSKPRSYRELPIRLAEFGTVYRYEQSGELGGLTRVRGFTQDDAHIFCTEEQVEGEFRSCIDFTLTVLKSLGLDDFRVRLGFRDPASSKYVGSAEAWTKAQDAIRKVAREMELPFTEEAGEAAFYGPKADFVVSDAIGREWQLGTVQLDYQLPSESRFFLQYVGADNQPHMPVMIHRAPLGSFERFMGVLIEHFAGAFPLWLAPEQVRVLSVSEKFAEYAQSVEQQLREAGFRVVGDYRPEKINAKIRAAQLELIPYMFVVGGREQETGSVAVRDRITGDLGSLPLSEAIEKLQIEVREKVVRQAVKPGAKLAASGSANEY
ncbi:MAG: threonine--tRNA ligase [Pirellulales bacterium]|nr:threonine--tRNA ligase [Pirellulales bacterium]